MIYNNYYYLLAYYIYKTTIVCFTHAQYYERPVLTVLVCIVLNGNAYHVYIVLNGYAYHVYIVLNGNVYHVLSNEQMDSYVSSSQQSIFDF